MHSTTPLDQASPPSVTATPSSMGRPRAAARWDKIPWLKTLEVACPYLFGFAVLAAWEIAVRVGNVPTYIVPGPLLIVQTLVNDMYTLWPSLMVTLGITVEAFVVSAVVGLLLALLFSSSRWVERTLFPYAVILQVTPIVAIAPLIIIWVKNTHLALLICATLVAFFPVVSNAAVGLNSTDRNLISLFRLYGASRRQTIMWLRLPAALPYYLAGLRISGGLALIGAVVAEFVAGTGGTGSGLAYRILESAYRLRIPRLFAALVLISLTGITIFVVLNWVSQLLLRRWHESAIVAD
jgi:NitT/TauT family transport system permease protein